MFALVPWSVGAGLEDRGVVVTGAAGGIGREVVRAFAAAGARVCAVDVDAEPVQDLVRSLDEPKRHTAAVVDLTDLDSHEPLLRHALQTFGNLRALTHLAAVIRRRLDIEEVTVEDWNKQVDLNLKGAFFLNRAAAQLFKERGEGGRIINFAAVDAWTGGYGGSLVYALTNGGIVSMSRGFARMLAPVGITVNTVAPGAVDTPMMRSGLTDAQVAAYVGTVPFGRMATPEELAGTAVFLASDHAAYITGATINVTGGQLMY
jgi:NAD(P)-dependent dehydrogenase (short-subunit alcohol dehydrogenase family)